MQSLEMRPREVRPIRRVDTSCRHSFQHRHSGDLRDATSEMVSKGIHRVHGCVPRAFAGLRMNAAAACRIECSRRFRLFSGLSARTKLATRCRSLRCWLARFRQAFAHASNLPNISLWSGRLLRSRSSLLQTGGSGAAHGVELKGWSRRRSVVFRWLREVASDPSDSLLTTKGPQGRVNSLAQPVEQQWSPTRYHTLVHAEHPHPRGCVSSDISGGCSGGCDGSQLILWGGAGQLTASASGSPLESSAWRTLEPVFCVREARLRRFLVSLITFVVKLIGGIRPVGITSALSSLCEQQNCAKVGVAAGHVSGLEYRCQWQTAIRAEAAIAARASTVAVTIWAK